MAYCFEFLSDDFQLDKVDEVVNLFFKKNKESWPCCLLVITMQKE